MVGEATQNALLTIDDATKLLCDLDGVGDAASHERLLSSWVDRCSQSVELKYLVRVIKKDLKIQAGDKVVLDGLGEGAYEAFKGKSDLRALVFKQASGSKLVRSESAGIKIGTALKPMLANQCKGAADALSKCRAGMICEIKYDGERLQVHKEGDSFSFWSRSQKAVAKHKVENVEKFLPKACPHGHSMILDSEVLLVDHNTGALLPFGSLGVHKKNNYSDASVCLFVFDILLFNDKCLLDTPLSERRALLEANLTPVPGKVLLSEKFDVKDEDELNQLIAKVLSENHEGLVIKALDGKYEPGARRWLKIKKDYLAGMADSVDLVVLGAYYGSGSKGGLKSVFLMGVYDERSKVWKTVVKVGNGFDDQQIEELQASLQMKLVSKKMHGDI